VTEALLAAPFLILAIALAAFLGPSLTNAMIAIGISAMPIFIRLARGADHVGDDRGLRGKRARRRPEARRIMTATSCPTSFRRSWCRRR
jgi:hypothetical protein